MYFFFLLVLYSDVNGETSTEDENVSIECRKGMGCIIYCRPSTHHFTPTINVCGTLCKCLRLCREVSDMYTDSLPISNVFGVFHLFYDVGIASEKKKKNG